MKCSSLGVYMLPYSSCMPLHSLPGATGSFSLQSSYCILQKLIFHMEGMELVLQGDIQKALSLSPEDALAAKAIFGLEPKVSI